MRKNDRCSAMVKPGRWRDALRQGGFSLIEIMVALVLGLVIVSAVIQLFLSTQQSGRIQQAASRMQEDGRIAISLLTRYIRLAGYVTNPWDNGDKTWIPQQGERGFSPPNTTNAGVPGFALGFAQDQVVMGGTVNSLDAIRVRYQGSADGSITDCQGNAITATQMADITLSLSADDPDDGRSLQCRAVVIDGATNPPTVTVRDNQPLVAGLQNIQIRYGLSQDVGGVSGMDAIGRLTGATSYVPANQVPAGQWNRVIGVQISLLARSDDRLTTAPQPYIFPITGTSTTPTDRRMRYVMGTTSNIRNRAP